MVTAGTIAPRNLVSDFGDESEIEIHNPPGGHKAEFDAWRWERLAALPGLIIPFKRPVYEQVLDAFRSVAAP